MSSERRSDDDYAGGVQPVRAPGAVAICVFQPPVEEWRCARFDLPALRPPGDAGVERHYAPAASRVDGPGSRGPIPHSGQGFTLIELLVVLAVMGVALAVTVPALPRPRAGDEATAHAAVRLFERARRMAVEEGVVVAVELDAGTGAYRIHAPAMEEGSRSAVRFGAIARRPDAWTGAAGSPLRVVRFDPLGRADGAAIHISGRADLTIDFEPWTGRPHVSR